MLATLLPQPDLPVLELEQAQCLSSEELFALAEQRARATGLDYAGSLYPTEAWALVQQGAAVLVDVRTAEELKYVGRVQDSLHVAWQAGPALLKNPRFVRDLENRVGRDRPVVLLCRSGKRSAAAASELTKKGFSHVYNVLEGFEGDLDEQQRRGECGGWRLRGLPWVQD